MTTNLRRRVCVGVACVLAATLTGCSTTTKKSGPTVHDAQVDGQYATQAAWVAKGQTLTVRLPTEGGSTFSWRYMADSTAGNCVDFMQMRTQQSSDGSIARRGEPAVDVFTFRARHSGNITLNFMYDNPWNPDTSNATQVALNVEVGTPVVMRTATSMMPGSSNSQTESESTMIWDSTTTSASEPVASADE